MIEEECPHSLAITKNTYLDGHTISHTRHLDLMAGAVLLQYTVSENTNVDRKWQIDVVYGTSVTVEYQFLHEKDAFTFQRFVTGYHPYRRFQNVFATAPVQRRLRFAKHITLIGEAQFWSGTPLEDEEQPATPIHLPVPDEGANITLAKRPPLLVLLAKSLTDGTYQILRVDSKSPLRQYCVLTTWLVVSLTARPPLPVKLAT